MDSMLRREPQDEQLEVVTSNKDQNGVERARDVGECEQSDAKPGNLGNPPVSLRPSRGHLTDISARTQEAQSEDDKVQAHIELDNSQQKPTRPPSLGPSLGFGMNMAKGKRELPVAVGFALRGVSVERGRHVCFPRPQPLDDRLQLKGVDLVLKPGKLVGILGASGSGKSTLLNLLAGRLSKRDVRSGDVCLYTRDGRRYRSFSEFPGSVRYVMSSDSFFYETTAEDILMMTAELATCYDLHKPDSLTAARTVNRIVQALDLQDALRTVVSRISGRMGTSTGESKRLMLAKEVCSDPRGLSCLLLDEPTTAVDTSLALVIFRFLVTSLRSGYLGTCICTLHQPSPTIFGMLDEVVILSYGHVVYAGPPGDMLSTIASLSSTVLGTIEASPRGDLDSIEKDLEQAQENHTILNTSSGSEVNQWVDFRPQPHIESGSTRLHMDDGDHNQLLQPSSVELAFNMLPDEMTETTDSLKLKSSHYSEAFFRTHGGQSVIEEVARSFSLPNKGTGITASLLWKSFVQTLWQLFLLTKALARTMFRIKAFRYYLPVLFLLEGLLLGALFRGSFQSTLHVVPENLANSSSLYNFAVPEAFNTLAHEDTAFDTLLQNGVTGNLSHPDPLKRLITWPALFEWAHKTLRCTHEAYGMGWDQTPDGENNTEWTYPSNWFFQQGKNLSWVNDVFSVPVPDVEAPALLGRKLQVDIDTTSTTEEASTTFPEDLPLDSDIAYDENYTFVTPRGLATEAVTLAHLVDLWLDKFNYSTYLEACESSYNDTIWYVCLMAQGFFRPLQPAITCAGLPKLAILGARTSLDKVAYLTSDALMPNDTDLHDEELEPVASPESNRRALRDMELGKNPILEELGRGKNTSPRVPPFQDTEASNITRRKLFIQINENWPFFVQMKYFFTEWLNLPLAYDVVTSILTGMTEGMSQVACVFFLTAALGFSSMMQMFVFGQMKPTAARDIANLHYSRLVFFVSFCLAMVPMDFLQAILCSLPFVMVSGLDPACWVQIAAVSILATIALAGLGLLVAAGSSDVNTSIRIVPVCLVCTIIFSGYFVREINTPIWLRWLIYCSPYRWGFFSFALLVLPDKEWTRRIDNDFVLGVNGVEDRSIGWCISMLIIQIFVFRIIAYLLFKFAWTHNHTR